MSIKLSALKTFIKTNKLLILILFLAIALRLAYFFILNPPLTWSDAANYDTLGWNLVQGNGYSFDGINPTPFVEPGYALFFLAPFYLIFGHNILFPQIFQIILSVGSVYIIYAIGCKFFNKKTGLLASFIWAIWPADIAFSQEILTETPFTFLLLLFTYFLLLAIKKDSKRTLIISSLILGTATITRFMPFLLPFFLLPALYITFKYKFIYKNFWHKSIMYFCILFLGIMMFFTPWAIRNYIHFNTFYLGRPGIGVGIWNGSYVPWEGEWKQKIPLYLDREIDVKNDRAYIKHDLRYIKENLGGVLKIYSKKPYKIFLKSVTYGQAAHNPELAKFLAVSPIIDILTRRGLQFTHLAIMLFGFIGLLYLFWKKEMFVSLIFTALIAYFIAIYLPFTPDARYQIPLMPYIIILASVGFWHFFEKIAEYRGYLAEHRGKLLRNSA